MFYKVKTMHVYKGVISTAMSDIWFVCMLSFLALTYKKGGQVYGANICSPPCLLVSNTSDIVAIDYRTAGVRPVVSGLARAVAIDVHFSLGYIYWSDVKERNIKRFRIDVASTTTIVTGIGVCDGLTVNWRSSQLYWTDTTYDKISVSDLNGNNKRTLISSGLHRPRAIATDPDHSLLIWTDWGSYPKIERASLSGNQRVAIVTTNLLWPNGIELDRGNKRIFWVDARMDKVESVDYDGNNRKLLFHQSGLHPFGVTLIPPFLFFTDWNTHKEVHKLDATTGKVIRSYSINGGRPMGIVAFNNARQTSASSPCAINNGGCSHFCVARTFGFECVCPTGLTVKQDGKTCEDKVRKFILFTDADAKSTNLISLDVNYFLAQTLFSHHGNQRPIALDFDPVEERVYWSDGAQGLIASAYFNATSLKVLFRCNVKNPDGLAIDHVGRNIYWTDTGTNRIEVARLDGTSRKLLIKDGLDEPRAIVLDERNGKMYWTDWGANPKIEQADMDGSARRTIITGNLTWPNGLAIDRATNRLFWADAKLDKIEASDLNGGNRQLIMSSAAEIHPYGLAVFQNVLYWTDWNSTSISSLNLSSGNLEMIVKGLQKPMDILVFDSSLTFSGAAHNCSQNNGLCSDLCLLIPRGYQCACPTGIALKSDGRTCDYEMFYMTSSEKFMIFAGANSGQIYKIPLELPETPCYHLEISTNISSPVAIDYDPVEGKIYWTDVTLKLVARAFLNGSLVEVLAFKNVDSPEGLAVDYIGRNLYWTDGGTSKIEVARLDGSSRKSLVTSSIEKPRAIILDIAERKMYWSDWGSSPKIEQANMDSSAKKTLVSSGLMWVNSLTLDFQSSLLYWCDAKLDKIERVDLKGNNRVLVLDLSLDNLHPFGLALSGDVLYWSDWNSRSVHQYNMTSSLRQVVVGGMGAPMELYIYDHTKTFNGSNTCSHLNGGCSHICLPNTHGHQCFCPEGVQLKSGDAFTCEGVNRCPQPYASSHGTLTPCPNLPGKTCQFSCDRGYALTGSTTRTCNSDGTWTGTQPQCNDILSPTFGLTCPVSVLLVYAEHGLLSAQVNWTVPVATDNSGVPPTVTSNYPPPQTLSQGTHVIIYTAMDQSGNRATCSFTIKVKVNRCPQLHAPSHGTLPPCSNLPGQTCQFSCDKGYNLTGSTTRTCNSNGTWTGTQTQCNVVTCPAITTESNGIRRSCSGTTVEYYNTVCLFSCDHGFNGSGSSSRKCLENGTWSGQDFICSAMTCAPLNTPPRAILLTVFCGNTYGSNCVFGCQSGYGSADGNVTRTCLHTGQWSGNPINCTDVHPPTFGVTCPANPLQVYTAGGMFSAQVNWTEPVATDNSGIPPAVTSNYQPPQTLSQGTHVIIYTAVDQSGNKATCSFTVKVTVINCTSLMVDPGGPLRMSSCSNNYGAKCNFSCSIGHRLNGSSLAKCVAPGNRPPGFWDNPLPKCQVIRCPSLPTPTNGDKTGCSDIVSEPYDTHCSFSCNVGYNLIGSSVRRCLENDTWSGDPSYCQAIKCGPLTPPTFVVISPSSCLFAGNHSQTCRFTCERPGYLLEGTSTRVCGKNGQWSGFNDTRCRDTAPPSFNNTCPNNMVFYTAECSSRAVLSWNEPMAIDNSGHVSISYPAIRPSVNLSIGLYNVLYSAIDSSGNQANCTFIVQVARKSCTVLQPPIHGVITSLSCGLSFGSQASISCNNGYRMVGSQKRSCSIDGTWSGNATTCDIVKCPAITSPTHGQIFPTPCQLVSGVRYKTHCLFMCNVTAGYRLQGERNVSCLESGSWSADTTNTICKDVQPPSIQCPRDMEIPTETGQPYALVTWQVPEPTDNSNEPLNLSGLRPPQKLNVGNKHITYNVTDSAGLTGSCTFSIQVKDLEPPKISSCPDDIHITSKKKLNKVLLPGVTVTDNVGVDLLTTSRPNGSEFTWGEHNVTYTASDKAENTAECHLQVVITDYTCPDLPAPLNGAKACETWLSGMICTVHCNEGFGFVNQPDQVYYCTPNGKWVNAKVPGKETPTLPDCSKTHKPKEAVVNGDLHYLVENCGGESMNEVIASKFIELFRNSPFGMAGGCNGKCTIDNVRVVCGDQTEARRRRDAGDGKQTSKIPLAVYFALRVPLPSNASLLDLNQTSLQISSDMLEALNETELSLNISGVVIEYDTSKPPVFRLVSLVCNEGQVQRGTKCVNCPLGYFFNITGCQACAVDQYQDQEAQASCLSCPSGTTTFGQTASKWRENCQEIPSPSNTAKPGISKPILYSAIAAGVVILITSVAVTTFCVHKHYVSGRPSSSHGRRIWPADDGIGHISNPMCAGTETIESNGPFCMKTVGKIQKCALSFDNMTYLPRDDAQEASEHDCKRLDFNQSEV